MRLRSRSRVQSSSLSRLFLLDTDVISDYLHGEPRANSYLEKIDGALMISVVTAAELFTDVREGPERSALESFLSVFETVEIDFDIAILAGLYYRDYHRKYKTTLCDAFIAATVKEKGATLVSLHAARYPMLKNVIEPYSLATD